MQIVPQRLLPYIQFFHYAITVFQANDCYSGFAGAFPVWLAPEQARIMNITDDQAAYCEEVYSRLRGLGVRIEKDLRNEKLNYKIREAQLMKVPYMLIIGEREKEDGTVTVRKRDGENLPAMTPEDFARLVREESSTRLHKA